MKFKEIFQEIWTNKDIDDRAKRMEKLDPDVAARIGALLRNCDQFQSVLDNPLIFLSSPTVKHQTARYSVTSELAKGGMGVVYTAYDSQMRRDVVLKCLLPKHQNNFQALQRFYNEAHITGQLQHPGIAAVYELGEFEDGRPFYSMKLVEGKTFTQVLADRDSHAAETPRALNFFLQICQTMAFAHERGIVHRDLKPSNIMVGKHGQTQIMDWGVAKRLASTDDVSNPTSTKRTELSEAEGAHQFEYDDANVAKSDLTRHGQIVGTPGYMSPEQAFGQNELIGKHSDVYSLGAILCEIVTGAVPDTFLDASTNQPESASSDLNQRLETARVDMEIADLARSCLQRKPENRPQDANAVAQAMLRYFASREQAARATQIKLEKELTRNEEARKRRFLFATCAAACLGLLIAGIVGTSIGFYKENVARARADAKANDARIAKDQAINARIAADESKAKAESRLTHLVKVNEILGSVFENLHPDQSARSGKPLIDLLAENLDKAAKQLEGNSIGAPDVIASFQAKIGNCYHALGFDKKAIPLMEKAHDFAMREYGIENEFTHNVQLRLANALSSDHQQDRALPLYSELREILSKNRSNESLFFLVQCNLAASYLHTRNRKKALEIIETRSEQGLQVIGVAYGLRLAEIYVLNQMPASAVELLNSMLSNTDGKYKFNDRELEKAHMFLGRSYVHLDQSQKAIPILEELIPRLQSRYGNSPNISHYASTFALGMAFQKVGRYGDSIEHLQNSAKLSEADTGGLHQYNVFPMYWLVEAYLKKGDLSNALKIANKIHATQLEKYGNDHLATYLSSEKLADIYLLINQPEKAKEYLDAAYTGYRIPNDDQKILLARKELKLAMVAANQGDLTRCSKKFHKAQELFGAMDEKKITVYPIFFDNLESQIWCVESLALQGDNDAIHLIKEIESRVKERSVGLEKLTIPAQQLFRTCVARYLIKPDETLIARLEEVIEILRQERLNGAQAHLLQQARSLLGMVYLKLGSTVEAGQLLESSFHSLQFIDNPLQPTRQATIDAGMRLKHFYLVTNASDEANRIAKTIESIDSDVDQVPAFTRALIDKTLTTESRQHDQSATPEKGVVQSPKFDN